MNQTPTVTAPPALQNGYKLVSSGGICYTLKNPEGRIEIWAFRETQPRNGKVMPFGVGYLKFCFDVENQNQKYKMLKVTNEVGETGERKKIENESSAESFWDSQWNRRATAQLGGREDEAFI